MAWIWATASANSASAKAKSISLPFLLNDSSAAFFAALAFVSSKSFPIEFRNDYLMLSSIKNVNAALEQMNYILIGSI